MSPIDEILCQFPPNVQASGVEPLGSAGGMSGAQFWRIETVGGGPAAVVRGSPDPAQQQRTLILRRWPAEHPTPDRLRFIHSVLDHAVQRGAASVPLPIRTTADESFVHVAGHLWELAPWMPGKADYETAPTIEKLRAAMKALAQFHIAVADFDRPTAPGSAGGSHAVQRHIARLRELSPPRVAGLSRAIDEKLWPELATLARQFVAALPRAVPRAIAQLEPLAAAGLPTQPCIRDVWHDHILFTGDEVTGIIDFGAVDFDTPATDITRLLGSLASCCPRRYSGEVKDSDSVWRDGLAAYSSVRPLSAMEVAAARALDASSTILAGCNWIRWIYIDDRQFDNQPQIIERFRRLLR